MPKTTKQRDENGRPGAAALGLAWPPTGKDVRAQLLEVQHAQHTMLAHLQAIMRKLDIPADEVQR